MFKLVLLSVLAVTGAFAAPKPSVLAAAPLAVAPAIAPAVVTAQSSQVVARNYNALVAPVAPVVAPASYVAPAPLLAPAPYAAAAPLLAPAPYAAAAPYLAPAPVVGPAPFLGASYRVAAPALTSPYFAAPGVVAPLL